MAGTETKRIIELTEASTVQSGDYIAIDSTARGTKKTPASVFAKAADLTAEQTARQQADEAEAQARQQADNALEGQVADLKSVLSAIRKSELVISASNYVAGSYNDDGSAGSTYHVIKTSPVIVNEGDGIQYNPNNFYVRWILLDSSGTKVEQYPSSINWSKDPINTTFAHSGTLYISVRNGYNAGNSSDISPSDIDFDINVLFHSFDGVLVKNLISSLVDCDYRTYSGGYVQASNGVVAENSNTGYTNYIDVSYFSKIYSPIDHAATYQMAFYDANKNYISGESDASAQIKVWEIPVPANAKYARLSFYLDVESTFYAKGTLKNLKAFIEGVANNGIKYSQMKMNCLGDSITYGYIPDSGAQMANPYPAILQDILPLAECRNYGISGSTLAVNSGNYQPMCQRYVNMDDDADIVLVFGGTNDYGRAVYTPDLGSITDNVNTSVYGALNILCEGLIAKYPKAFIFLCTPLKRADKTGANGGGYTLEDVANAIREVGQKFGMPVLDLNYKGGFYISNSTFRGQYGGNDKLHPNQAFDEEHLAPMIATFIKSNL